MAKRPLVLVDARMTEGTSHGISRYVRHLAAAVSAVEYELGYILHAGATTPEDLRGKKIFYAESAFLSPREWFEIPRLVRDAEAALFHSPSFASFPALPCPWIVTVHDLNHLRFGGFLQKQYYKRFLKPFCKGAEQVLTVSQAARQELVEWLGWKEEQIEIAPNVIDAPEWLSDARILHILQQRGLARGKFFLSLTSSKPHKNLPLLIDAYLKSNVEDWPLVVTAKLESVTSDRVIGLGGVSDEEAVALLVSAGGFLFPSLYEGFGRPPLEAAVLGARLAVSDIPVHREALGVVSKAPVRWVLPSDLEGWAQAFRALRAGEVPPFETAARETILSAYAPEVLAKVMDRVYRRVLGL